MLTVVIPTLQKNVKVLRMLLDELNEDESVGEIILIDNSLKGFDYESEKLRLIVPEQNLFVNMSWNLGVKEAKFDYVGILNDDLLLPKNLCSEVLNFIKTNDIGLVGIDKKSIYGYEPEEIEDYPQNSEIEFLPQKNDVKIGYWGVGIFGDKNNFPEIPQEMKIWCGDNFLLKMNEDVGRKNYKLKCEMIIHIGSLSCKASKFDKIKYDDVAFYKTIDKRFEKFKFPTEETPLAQKIFTLTNSSDRRRKVLTILGMTFSWARKECQ